MATRARQSTSTSVTRAGGEVAPRQRRTATITLPFVTAQFRAPDIHLPSIPLRTPQRTDLNRALATIRSGLPSPEKAGLYAGLAAMGALEIIEWPVVLAIAAASAITQRVGGQDGGAHPDGAESSARGLAHGQATTRAGTTTQRQRSVPRQRSARRSGS